MIPLILDDQSEFATRDAQGKLTGRTIRVLADPLDMAFQYDGDLRAAILRGTAKAFDVATDEEVTF